MKKTLLTGGFATLLLLGACSSEEPEAAEESVEEESVEESSNEETTEEATTESANTEAETEESETVERDENNSEVKAMENGAFEIQMAKVEIKDTKILPPGEYSDTGKDRLVVFYDVTSKVTPEEAGETEVSPIMVWTATVEATQETPDTIEDLNVGSVPMDEEYDKYLDTQMSVIKKDKTVENVTVYELENRENPVILKATQGFGGQDLGQMEIDVTE
ncbi:DUF5067 domain-containing protein [Salinicoccus roseus]|uniref:DUF5067 domain-containing protein n=1 Tax=Salinicoccus roseus TaxID=45670 RepID=UPI001585ADC0|nr:DUF5067 domain-containing protein [Salinicoccus roseus]